MRLTLQNNRLYSSLILIYIWHRISWNFTAIKQQTHPYSILNLARYHHHLNQGVLIVLLEYNVISTSILRRVFTSGCHHHAGIGAARGRGHQGRGRRRSFKTRGCWGRGGRLRPLSSASGSGSWRGTRALESLLKWQHTSLVSFAKTVPEIQNSNFQKVEVTDSITLKKCNDLVQKIDHFQGYETKASLHSMHDKAALLPSSSFSTWLSACIKDERFIKTLWWLAN